MVILAKPVAVVNVFLEKCARNLVRVEGVFSGGTFLRKRFPRTPSQTFLICCSRFAWLIWWGGDFFEIFRLVKLKFVRPADMKLV